VGGGANSFRRFSIESARNTYSCIRKWNFFAEISAKYHATNAADFLARAFELTNARSNTIDL
jgi:hypothetical protein